MKKSIIILSTITASLIAIAIPNHKTHADSVNGNTVVKVEGHNYYLDNDQIASHDGDKLYIDGQEVILTPDPLEVTPPETPTQVEPQQQLTPEAPIQAVPTPIQEVPETPVTPTEPTQEVPTKTPDKPLQQVENVPVKTYPQDNTPLPTQKPETFPVTVIEDRPNKSNITQGVTETTQTPQTFPTTTIKDTEKVEPIKVPTETVPIETIKEQLNDTKPVEQLKTVASITPQATDKPSASVKAPSQPITPKATQTLTQAPQVATATLPTTGTDDSLSNIATIVGVVIMLLASVGAFITRKDNKNTKEFK